MPAAHDAAQRAIEEQAILRLSAEDQRRFAEALIPPRSGKMTPLSIANLGA